MKKLIIAALLGIVSVSAMGQVKKDTATFLFQGATGATIGTTIRPVYYNFASANSIWFQIKPMPSFERTDSLILHVKRSKLRWINDSTAVITK